MYLLNPNGEIVWKYETDGQIWSSPSYYDNMIYFGSDDGFIYSVSPNGSLKWKSKLNGRVRSSSPCLSKGLLFIGTHEG
jgi:eukaryotic-like serine/threonine-protein kinase